MLETALSCGVDHSPEGVLRMLRKVDPVLAIASMLALTAAGAGWAGSAPMVCR